MRNEPIRQLVLDQLRRLIDAKGLSDRVAAAIDGDDVVLSGGAMRVAVRTGGNAVSVAADMMRAIDMLAAATTKAEAGR
jgi:hypothetical protein